MKIQSHFPPFKGEYSIRLYEAGICTFEYLSPNLIVYDAGILAAYQLTGTSPVRNLTMLAIGSGATGNPQNPDAPNPNQRSLNNEIARKAFSAVRYVDSTGATSSVPTHVVDYTVSFGNGEAVGALNEMGLISPLSSNPLVLTPNPDTFPNYDETRDVRSFDILANYTTYPVINKPSISTLTITWRLTF